jgi:outer membrane protein assembly factor BamB
MKSKFSYILVLILLGSMLVMCSNFQSKVAASSPTGPVQPADPDWWSMFHHDLAHSGYSTSAAPKTNQTLWTYTTGAGVEFSPTVVNSQVYVGSDDDNVYALNAATGALVWKYTTGSYVGSSPAVAGGVVYVGSYDDNVYALNATTGVLVWKYTTGAGIWESSPAVANGVVYIGSDDDNVYALNAATGALVWKYTTGGQVTSSPAVANGVVYIGSDDDNVYALNATTGARLWKYTTGSYVWSSPAVASGIVYVGSSDDNVYALNATTGARLWKYTTGSYVWSSPAVANDTVLIGSRDYDVYALNATTGALVWKYTTGSYVWSSPTFANGVVFVGSEDDNVYAFGLALTVSISPGPVYMDIGQSRTFTSYVSGSASPYSYQWYLNGNPISGATDASWTFTPTSSGPCTIYLKVTDANSGAATSNADSFTVNGAPSVSISPASVILDVGQSQLFTSSISNGTSPYSYQWYFDGVAVSGATSATWAYTPSAAGSRTVCVKVTDSVSVIATSNIVAVTVSGAFSVSISPISVILDVGQSQLFTSSISNGTSPYSYQWYVNGVAISGATSASWTYAPQSAGAYTIYVNATDNASVAVTVQSDPASMTVNAAPSVTISPTPVVINVGLSQTFSSAISGGTSPFFYQWYLNGNPVSGATSATWTFTPSSIGSYSVCVKINDTVGIGATSNNSNVTVTLPHVPMPAGGLIGITGYKLVFEQIVNNSFSSPTTINYYWSFNADKWNGTQWIAGGISGSTVLVSGYLIPANKTVDLPYNVYVLNLSAVNWGEWLKISYTFYWTYNSINYSVVYMAKLNVHSGDIAGAATVAFPYLGADGKVDLLDLTTVTGNWLKSWTAATAPDPTSAEARADINGANKVDLLDLTLVTGNWLRTWTNTPPPG